MDTSTPETVYFDPHGDITLLVRDHEQAIDKRFVVSSKTMTFACNAWERMLAPDGHFKEAQSTNAMQEIPFPDDNAAALSILLNIAHLRFEKIPPTLDFGNLLALSVLTDKYGATSLVRPWIKGWIDQLRDEVDLSGREEWLWVAWEFGEQDVFEHLTKKLTKEVTVRSDGKPVTQEGRVLDPEDDGCFFPPGIIESIVAVRRQTIVDLLDECYKYVHMYRLGSADRNTTSICKQNYNKKECDALTLGSLAISLQKLELSLGGFDADKVHLSVLDLSSKLSAVQIFTYPVDEYRRGYYSYNHNYEDHDDCNFQKKLGSAIKKTVNNMPSAVLESHRIHIERQHVILK